MAPTIRLARAAGAGGKDIVAYTRVFVCSGSLTKRGETRWPAVVRLFG